MGNKQTPEIKNVLIGQQTLIVLNSQKGRTLKMTHIIRFPHGFDGLRIWQSGIVLARYAIINREFFKDKFVLELGSGTGIAGLSVLKFTSCKNCLMSDYLPEVVENARKNCRDNGMQKAVVMKMNWKDYMSFNNRYDIIIGAEIVSPGGPLQELYLTLNRFLVQGGVAMLVIPQKKGYIEQLLKYVDKNVFEVERQELTGENYLQSPMANKLEGYETFPGLSTQTYEMCILKKKIQPKSEHKSDGIASVSKGEGNQPVAPVRQSHNEPSLAHYDRERVLTQIIHIPNANSVEQVQTTQAKQQLAQPSKVPIPSKEQEHSIQQQPSKSISPVKQQTKETNKQKPTNVAEIEVKQTIKIQEVVRVADQIKQKAIQHKQQSNNNEQSKNKPVINTESGEQSKPQHGGDTRIKSQPLQEKQSVEKSNSRIEETEVKIDSAPIQDHKSISHPTEQSKDININLTEKQPKKQQTAEEVDQLNQEKIQPTELQSNEGAQEQKQEEKNSSEKQEKAKTSSEENEENKCQEEHKDSSKQDKSIQPSAPKHEQSSEPSQPEE